MRRIALVTAVVAVLLLIDGAYLQLTNNEVGGDSGVLFGNPNLFLSAGTVVLISGGLMLLGAGLMWAVAIQRSRRLPEAGQAAQAAQPGQAVQPQTGDAAGAVAAEPAAVPAAQASAATAQASVPAAQEPQTGKGQDHQRQP
jgi:hypothetical protein